MIWYFFLPFSLLINPSPPLAGNLGDQNLSYLYDRNSEMDIRSRLMYTDDSANLLLHIRMRKDVYEMTDYYVFEEYLKSYNEKVGSTTDTVSILDHIIKRTRNGFYFSIKLKKLNDRALYVLHFANKHNQKHFYYSFPLSSVKKSDFLFYGEDNLPLVQNWISEESKVKLISTSNDSLIYTYYYSYDFSPADPPMLTESSGSAALSIDSLYSFRIEDTPSLRKEGLYFVQSDTSSLQGFSFRVQDSYFPKLARIDDIINSLRYFSTRSEWEKLNAATNKKEALDLYWINIMRSPDLAKSVIKNYFDQVEEANRLFTNYKEGWKTDMGMIYIILGAPDEVHRNQQFEEWIYERTEDLPKLKFTFEKINNIFADSHFVLVRNEDYRNDWFRAVEIWRKGRFETLIR